MYDFESQSATASLLRYFPNNGMGLGISAKGSLKERRGVVHVSGSYPLPDLPVMISVGVNSEKKISLSLMGMLGDFLQTQVSFGYCSSNGPVGSFMLEINENAVVL